MCAQQPQRVTWMKLALTFIQPFMWHLCVVYLQVYNLNKDNQAEGSKQLLISINELCLQRDSSNMEAQVFSWIISWFSDISPLNFISQLFFSFSKSLLLSLPKLTSVLVAPSPSVAQLDVVGFNVMKKFIYAVETRGTMWLTHLPAWVFMFCNSKDSTWTNEHSLLPPSPPRYRWAGFIQNRWRQLQSTKTTEPCYG